KRAAQYRLVDDIDSKLDRVRSNDPTQVIPELVLVLLSLDRESGDRRHKLVVPESLESRISMEVSAERKCQRKAQVRVTGLGMVKDRGLYQTIPHPVRVERVLMIQQNAVVIRAGKRPGRGQRRLLNQIVLGVVAVKRPTQKPLRAR